MRITPCHVEPLIIRYSAVGSQTRMAPTSGSNDSIAINAPHRIGERIPSSMKISAPNAPCRAAIARLLLTVARTTAANRPNSASTRSARMGTASLT